MQSLSLLLFLLATFVVTIYADGTISAYRDDVATSTTTTTLPPASTAISSSTLGTQASTTSTRASSTSASTISTSSATSGTQASTTSTTASSTSASATSTSSATSTPFRWDGAEIAALVVLLGFIFLGIAVIATWQIRRMRATRRDKAGFGAYSKHKINPSADMDAPGFDAGMMMDQRTQPLEPYGSLPHNDLEHQPTGYSATMYQYPTTGEPAHSAAVYTDPPRDEISPISYSHQARPFSPYSNQARPFSPYSQQARSPSPYSAAVTRPLSENTLRRLYSFEDISGSTTQLH